MKDNDLNLNKGLSEINLMQETQKDKEIANKINEGRNLYIINPNKSCRIRTEYAMIKSAIKNKSVDFQLIIITINQKDAFKILREINQLLRHTSLNCKFINSSFEISPNVLITKEELIKNDWLKEIKNNRIENVLLYCQNNQNIKKEINQFVNIFRFIKQKIIIVEQNNKIDDNFITRIIGFETINANKCSNNLITKQIGYIIKSENKSSKLELILNANKSISIIIFVDEIKTANSLVSKLKQNNINCLLITNGTKSSEHKEIIDIYNNKKGILITTIDNLNEFPVRDVNLSINYSAGKNIKRYIRRKNYLKKFYNNKIIYLIGESEMDNMAKLQKADNDKIEIKSEITNKSNVAKNRQTNNSMQFYDFAKYKNSHRQ